MPYILTTTTERATARSANGSELERHARSGTRDVTRRAVATLDEARDAMRKVLTPIYAEHPEWDLEADLALTTEQGGSIGPLPDGTVIEVQRVSWPWIVGVAEDKGLDTELLYDEGGDLAILAALNEVL